MSITTGLDEGFSLISFQGEARGGYKFRRVLGRLSEHFHQIRGSDSGQNEGLGNRSLVDAAFQIVSGSSDRLEWFINSSST